MIMSDLTKCNLFFQKGQCTFKEIVNVVSKLYDNDGQI